MEERKRIESDTKEYVDVIAAHYAVDGRIEPIRFRRADGTRFDISRVLDARKAASLRAGGHGMRYTCRAANAEDGFEFKLYLFHDGLFWFIEIDEGRHVICADGTIQE